MRCVTQQLICADHHTAGNPGTPGKPTVRNYAEDGKLRVTFAVPENDNAGR